MRKSVGISESIGLTANVNMWYLIKYVCFYVIDLSCESTCVTCLCYDLDLFCYALYDNCGNVL